MPERSDPEPVFQLHPPLTSVPWLASFVAQSLEVLFLYLEAGDGHRLHAIHSETLRLGLTPDHSPGDVVMDALERYGLTPLVVHSTSWRHEEGRLILTYVAVVEPPVELSPYLADEPIERASLARGDAFGPPADIGTNQVTEHALRHLAWLVKDDAVVGERLQGWVAFLADYEPEPFRAFGSPAM